MHSNIKTIFLTIYTVVDPDPQRDIIIIVKSQSVGKMILNISVELVDASISKKLPVTDDITVLVR